MPTLGSFVFPTGKEASGRRSLLDIVDELSRPIDASDTTVRALAADAFRAAVRTMNRRGLWPWEVLDEELTLTANAQFSAVQSAIKKPLAMHYLDATGGKPNQRLVYVSYDRFVEQFDLSQTGLATTYTIPNMFETGQVAWYPIPSATAYARLTYYRVTPAPRTESQAVEIPDHALEVYMAFAWAEFLKRMPEQQRPFPIAVALSEARMAFRELSAHVTSPGDRQREVSIYG